MKIWTYGELLAQIQKELDLQNETNILADEYVEYCNEAIHQAESEILTLYEDYFLTSAALSITSGSSNVTTPSDMYAAKIRRIIHDDGSRIYRVRKLRGPKMFEELHQRNISNTQDDYRYWIKNVGGATGFRIMLTPAARETSSSLLTAYYIRNAARIPLVTAGSQAASNASYIDLPEFYTFIKQYMKVRCLEKDGADPRLPGAVAILEKEREVMVSTLSAAQPDDDNEVPADFTHYEDHE